MGLAFLPPDSSENVEQHNLQQRLDSLRAKFKAAGFNDRQTELIIAQIWLESDYVKEDDLVQLLDVISDKITDI